MSVTPPLLYVLRHGETEWNREGRLQGWKDSPLTPKGLQQAARQRDILSSVLTGDELWVTSPLGRAVQTAQIAGAPMQLHHDPSLREIDMGVWTGWSSAQIAAERPDLEGFARYDAIPQGETIADVSLRVAGFLAQCEAPTVVITHGITSRILRCLAIGKAADSFAEIGGGQGVVYRVEAGVQNLLS